ncbi:MAG: hypothetical protein H0X28_01365 [Solirubrobacterales bacterium]|nr:hypothetical protein [Solirubrobacterales bacterium]
MSQGLHTSQILGTVFDGITRHTREGFASSSARRKPASSKPSASVTSRSATSAARPRA